MRWLGALAPSFPSAVAGMMVGKPAAKAVVAPARFRNSLRVNFMG
jgi:hypothetical protein